MTGCLKKADKPERKPESKYFMPKQLLPDENLPSYFSGAGYFISKSALSKILPIRDTIPILPLDDIYVGKLIVAAGLSQEMRQSVSICTGVHAFEKAIYKGAMGGWGLKEAPNDPCFMSCLTVFHRFAVPKELVTSFNKVKEGENSKRCTEPLITKIASRWAKKSSQRFIAEEFIILCNNYANPVLLT